MDCLPKTRILEFNPNQLESVRKQYNLEKPGDMNRAVDVLEAWVKEQKHFTKKELPRNYLEKTILASKGSLERAKQRIDKICTFRTMMPAFFGDNLTKNNFEEYVIRSILLPKPTNDNYRVFILKAVGSTFTVTQIWDCYWFIIIACEYFMAYDYCDGVIVIIDHSEVQLFELMKSITLSELYQFFTIITEGFGLRLKAIHEVTSSKAANAFVAMLKHVLSPKIASRVHIHKDISAVLQYVPKDILPVEYGGKEKSLAELYGELRNEIIGDFRKYLEDMNEAKTDESRRESGAFNEQYLGVPGSFRVLNVD